MGISAMILDRFNFGVDYYVGVQEIDRQHATFFEIYNDIADRVNRNELHTTRMVQGVANRLFMYAKYHFKEEQWLMSLFEYPDLRKHFDEHYYLISRLDSTPLTTAPPDKVLSVIIEFVHIWSEHILTTDQALGLYMRNRSEVETLYHSNHSASYS